MKPLIAGVAAVLALCAPAAAQTTTKGSNLQAAPNTAFGCEAMPVQDFFVGFAVLPQPGQQSCSWWSTGSAALVGDPRGSQVPSTGTVTTVRIRSGANPAPLRVVINRVINGRCCGGVARSDVLTPQPNAVSSFTVNLPVENVKDVEKQISWFDYVGVSAAANTGTLPIHDQGPAAHTPEAAISNPNVISSSMSAPELLPTDGPRIDQHGAPGFDVLLQYDHVKCPTAPNGQPLARAAQVGCRAAPPAPPAPAGSPGPAPNPSGPAGPIVRDPVPPQRPEFIGSAGLRARSGRVPVVVRCALTVPCRGMLRLRTRGAKPRTLATLQATIPAGTTKTLRPKLNTVGRRLVRTRPLPARLQLDLGTGGVFSRDVTLRR